VLPIALVVALFFPSFYGDDQSNVMPRDQVETLLAFQQKATPGPVLAPIGNAPLSDTAKYNQFPVGDILGAGGVWGSRQVTPDIASFLARTMEHYYGNKPAYIVMTPSMVPYNQANGVAPPSSVSSLLASLAKSPYWALLTSYKGTLIYQLSAAASNVPAGTYASSQNMAIQAPL
jgi:hypothetical protein